MADNASIPAKELRSKKDVLLTVVKCAVALTLFVIGIVKYDALVNFRLEDYIDVSRGLWLAVGTILLIYVVKALLFVIPASLIYIAVGQVMSVMLADAPFSPMWVAVPLNLFGIILELTATYLLGIFLGGATVEKLLKKNKNGQKILSSGVKEKPWLIFTIRFSGAPIDFVSLLYGSLKTNYFKYLVFSLLGIAPRVIVMTIIGKVIDIIPREVLIGLILAAIPAGIVYYLVKKYVLDPKKAAKEAEREAGNAENAQTSSEAGQNMIKETVDNHENAE